MGRREWGWLAALVWLPWLVGCGESTSPGGEVVEVYELVEVAGEPVPATIEEGPGAFRTYVSDVIRIYDDESWDRIQQMRFRPAGAPEQELNSTSEGTVVRDGDGAVLSYECNDTASCVAPDRLRFLPDGGAVIERAFAPDSVLVWRYRGAGPST